MRFSLSEQGVIKVRNFWIVFQTIYKESVKTKAYINITIGLVLLSLLLFASPMLIDLLKKNETGKTYTIINETNLPLSADELVAQDDRWTISKSDNLDALKEAVKDGDLSAVYVLDELSGQLQLDIYTQKIDQESLLTLEAYITQVKLDSLEENVEIDAAILQSLNTPIVSQLQPLYESKPNALIIVYGLISIMFLAISTYGNNVATAIASEKSSRVMEVMITKVSPVPMMYGKILGIGLASLTQLFIFLASFFVWDRLNLFTIEEGSMIQTVMETMTIETVFLILVFFILGYFIYATLFAIVGSMVSRPDDLSSAVMPIIIVLMGSLVVELLFVMDYPEGKMAVITSYIPFTAPMSVLVRMVYETISIVEISVTFLVMLLFIAVFAAVAAKIYPKGVLKSDAMTFKQLIQFNR